MPIRSADVPDAGPGNLIQTQDYVAIRGQGTVFDRSRERLAQSDAGIAILRRIFFRELDAIRAGRPTKSWRKLEHAAELPEMLADNASPARLEWRAMVVPAIEAIIAANRGRRVAAVCHGGVINAYLSHVLGLGTPMFFEPNYTSVHRVIAASSGERTIATVNEMHFLRDLP